MFAFCQHFSIFFESGDISYKFSEFLAIFSSISGLFCPKLKYTKLGHQRLFGLHAHSSTQPPAFCLFLANLSLIYKGAIGQPK